MAISSQIIGNFLTLTLLVDVRKIRTRLRWIYECAGFQLKTVQNSCENISFSHIFIHDKYSSKQITWFQEKVHCIHPGFSIKICAPLFVSLSLLHAVTPHFGRTNQNREIVDQFLERTLSSWIKPRSPYSSTVLALGGPGAGYEAALGRGMIMVARALIDENTPSYIYLTSASVYSSTRIYVFARKRIHFRDTRWIRSLGLRRSG